jgi:uncharacterized protein YecE (DUF72 family)
VTADIRIGTSGWHYKHWLGNFYPHRLPVSKMLGEYVRKFDTVEINNSFYRLPSENAVNQWRESAPEGFVFAVKGSRFLTHMKKLKDPELGLERFFARANLLAEKLGPILFQLPPHWNADVDRLRSFLDALPAYHHYCFEFRNDTWNREEVFQLLRSRNIGYCIFHLAGYESPVLITADFVYLRLHGPGGKYQGSYDDGVLRGVADKINRWRNDLRAFYCYFDNDEAGYAAHDALRLRAMVWG